MHNMLQEIPKENYFQLQCHSYAIYSQLGKTYEWPGIPTGLLLLNEHIIFL